jgi:hypothetical protein
MAERCSFCKNAEQNFDRNEEFCCVKCGKPIKFNSDYESRITMKDNCKNAVEGFSE